MTKHKFTSTNQPKEFAISEGMINKNACKNILYHLRTNIENRDIITKIFDRVEEEIEIGSVKNAIELIKIAKEPETQDINIKGDIKEIKIEQKDIDKIIKATKELADEG